MIRVLIVDDVAVLRLALNKAFSESNDFEVVGSARDGEEALAKIDILGPDLVILDLEMPVMNGLEVLQALRSRNRKPKVVVFSAQNSDAADVTMAALNAGAVDFVLKPQSNSGFSGLVNDLIPRCREIINPGSALADHSARRTAVAPPSPTPTAATSTERSILCIASSTGGPGALRTALEPFPANFPVPIIVIQHIPPVFSRSLAESLHRDLTISVCEATEGQNIQPGVVYICPGDYHMTLGSDLCLHLNQDPPVMSLRPVADFMFESLARLSGAKTVAAIFTGMGDDGLRGGKLLRMSGAHLMSQTKESCVVYGMPRAIDEAGLSHCHFTPETFYNEIRGMNWQWKA